MTDIPTADRNTPYMDPTLPQCYDPCYAMTQMTSYAMTQMTTSFSEYINSHVETPYKEL